MSDSLRKLSRAAKQLLETDSMLGGDFMPVGRRGLPTVQVGEGEAGASLQVASAGQSDAAPAQVATQSPSGALPIGATMTPQQKADALAKLNAEHISTCGLCALQRTRTNTVLGEGNPAGGLVFVGEAPGYDEDQTGRPFVGKAGQLLDKMIAAMGLSRADVYICNVLKCRPPDNRPPAPEEVVACSPYLVRQLEILAPKVIVTLGNPATQTLLKTRTGITQIRGQWQALPPAWQSLAGTPVMPTFHPSYVLRTYTPEVRGKVWSDLQKVMEKLGMKPNRD